MKNTLLFLFAVFLALLISEVLVRMVFPQNLSGSWRELSKDNSYLLNKSSGVSKHEFGKRRVVYQFEYPHLRSTQNEKTECNKRILVLGDSYTFGWLLDAQYTYVSKIEKFFIDQGLSYCFYNAAAGDWGVAEYTAFYEDFGGEVKPDLILVFLNSDDISRAYRRKIYTLSEEGITRVSSPTQLLRLKQIMNTLPGYQWLLEHSHLFQLLRSILLGSSSHQIMTEDALEDEMNWSIGMGSELSSSKEASAAVNLAEGLFVRLNDLAALSDVKLLVVTTGWQAFAKNVNDRNPNAIFYQQAKKFFDSESIAFVDTADKLSRLLDGSINDIVIPIDQHPNENGASLIFQASITEISNFMENYFLLVQE